MMIAILTENITYGSLLKQALESLGFVVSLNPDVTQKQENSLYITVIDQKNMKFNQNRPCFAILADESCLFDYKKEDFEEIFTMPVRLGYLLKHVQSFYQKKSLSQREDVIDFGAYILNPQNRIFTVKDKEKDIQLTEKETDLLCFLYQYKGTAVARHTLLQKIWGYVEDIETHTLETHIYRLRQKIEENPMVPTFIVTEEDGYFLKF